MKRPDNSPNTAFLAELDKALAAEEQAEAAPRRRVRQPRGLRPQDPEAEALEIVIAGIRDDDQDESTYDTLSVLYDEDEGEFIKVGVGLAIS